MVVEHMNCTHEIIVHKFVTITLRNADLTFPDMFVCLDNGEAPSKLLNMAKQISTSMTSWSCLSSYIE